MAAKKTTRKKTPAKRSRARAAAPPAPLTCEDCGRELQPGEDPAIAETGGCIRCKYEQQHPGRDYDRDAYAADKRGLRLSTYLREQLEGEQLEGRKVLG